MGIDTIGELRKTVDTATPEQLKEIAWWYIGENKQELFERIEGLEPNDIHDFLDRFSPERKH